MRSEADIFSDLCSLCQSAGYVHALAHICFRDSFVAYEDKLRAEDMEHHLAPDRLIPTEISTLIGLMIQREVNWAFPGLDTTKRYVDETHALLEEFHHAMIQPTIEEILVAHESGAKKDVFRRGAHLREPIFYGGESAYAFQFRDFSVLKYGADDRWLEEHLGFTIRDARDVVRTIVLYRSAKVADAIYRIAPENIDKWTVLPGLLFSIDEIAAHSSLPIDRIQRVLSAFTLEAAETNSSFRAIGDFNVVSATPLIQAGDGNLLLLEGRMLEMSLYESPFYWMCKDKAYVDSASRNRGSFVEHFASTRLESVFGKRAVFQNVRVVAAKGRDASEIDVLVLFGNRALIVQAKSKRMTLGARKGNDHLIRDYFQKSVQDSYDQALFCARMLSQSAPLLVTIQGIEVQVPYKFSEIYILCVVADHYPALSFQTRQFLRYEQDSVVQAPFVLDIFTLDTMAEMLQSPLYFLSYVARRATYRETVHASQELAILAFHLKKNLWFEKTYSYVQVPDDMTSELEVAMTARREGIPGETTPDGILTRLRGTSVGQIVSNIESRLDARTLSLGFMLLTLGGKALVDLSQAIDDLVLRARLDGIPHDLTVPIGESFEGLTIHCNIKPLEIAATDLRAHCLMRKYKSKARRWHGLCLSPHATLRFGVSLDFEWKHDGKMETLVGDSLKPARTVDLSSTDKQRSKIGRNDPCPCRSGRKYKKCCLL